LAGASWHFGVRPDRSTGEEPEASQSVTVNGVTYDLGSLSGQKAAKRDGVLPRQSDEDYERDVEASKEFHRRRLETSPVQPKRRLDYDADTGVYTHQVWSGEGWSEPEALDDQMIEAERHHSPSWHETERRAIAALTGLRRAERLLRHMRVVPSARPNGRYEHRPGCRRATASRGPPDDGDGGDPDSDGDVLAPGVARAFPLSRPVAPRHVSVAPGLFVEQTSVGPYSFRQHHTRFGHLTPAERLAVFLTLPHWQRRQAWRSLRFDIARERGPPAVTSVRP
jgi:hypothetical protein